MLEEKPHHNHSPCVFETRPESNGSQYAGGDTPKLRTACENCRQSKVKCNLSGKSVCTRCLRHGLQCQYGFANRSGKPKGSKNRATLRKLGQLQEEKPPLRGYRGSRLVPPVVEREPLVAGGYSGHLTDPMVADEVYMISSPPGIWESPRSLGHAAALEMPICPSQLTAVDGSPYVDLLDTRSTFPVSLGYPHTPVTPTFLPSDPLGDGMASPSFDGGSMPSPYSAAQCDCVDMQLFHMNRLNHLLAEPMPLRFDHSLQAIKSTFCASRVFLQCEKCVKDSANLLLVISVLNLTLQLFEYWIPCENPRVSRVGNELEIRYGYYELCHEEDKQIRALLLRSLLLQCRDVLSILTSAISTISHEVPKLADSAGSIEIKPGSEDLSSQSWARSDPPEVSEPDAMSNAPEGNCLLPIIAGYEATVEAFLQSVAPKQCTCGSTIASHEGNI